MRQPVIRSAAFFACLTLCLPGLGRAADLHVSPDGSDRNAGTRSAPFKTLAAARDAARALVGKEPVTVHVADGVYYLPDSLVFEAPDSGTAQHPVIYQAEHEGEAVISGGLKLDLKWEPADHGTFRAAVPPGLRIDQLFVDGRRQHMARYPNFDPNKPTAAYQGYAADAFSKERAASWADPAGGFIHAMHSARWGGYHYRITGKNPDGTVAFEGGWQNNRQMGMHKEFRMVENIREELDAPGEWFHDAKAGLLWLLPMPGTDLGKATVEIVRLPNLIELRGTAGKPVKNLTFKGFTFRHSARTFMENKEPLLRSDWTIHRGGALLLTGTEKVSILDCTFDQPGGNAVFVNRYNRHTLVKGCHIHDTGASGVCFVGGPEAVRNPLFEYGQSQDLSKIDTAKGPKTSDYPADCAVEDCLIHGIGRVERQPAGIQVSMALRISVRDTTIHDCARAGINISEGTWGGHLIEHCDVFDTVLETHDHGSFNSWGRDRFWSSNHRGVSEPAVKKNPDLPYLDVIEPITIRDSRWRCDHGWDIDLDDGSSNYRVYNNLMLAGGLKFREGYGREAWNNILINNGFHPHVWFDDSASGFRHNIVMRAHAPIGQPAGWGKLVDENLFLTESDRKRHLGSGGDSRSISGDPMFVDPAAGDFRVKEGSPALRIGFKNFPMDRFGVKKPSLKALAKTPVIPPLDLGQPAPEQAVERGIYWLGARLHALEGQEFSAFGVSREDMGVQMVDVPKGSAAAACGFKPNDLIQGIGTHKVSNTGQLFAALLQTGNAPQEIRMVRDQRKMTVKPAAVHRHLLETSASAGGFRKLAPAPHHAHQISTRPDTANSPPATLVDGALADNYGPVFKNGETVGRYKFDLGSSKAVRALTAWSYNQNNNRGRQCFTWYGSNSSGDPGWITTDTATFSAIGSMDTSAIPAAAFTATSIAAADGSNLGKFRWIVVETHPVSATGEHTAWQEFGIETTE